MSKKWKAVYTIVEKPQEGDLPAYKLWIRIGTAFVNKDESLNVLLHAMPIDGTLHIRDYDAALTAPDPKREEP